MYQKWYFFVPHNFKRHIYTGRTNALLVTSKSSLLQLPGHCRGAHQRRFASSAHVHPLYPMGWPCFVRPLPEMVYLLIHFYAKYIMITPILLGSRAGRKPFMPFVMLVDVGRFNIWNRIFNIWYIFSFRTSDSNCPLPIFCHPDPAT
jgi:hypothetical protein